jgi:hypothetical protein
VCENGVLKRLFGPKGKELAGGWRSLHNEEPSNIYCSPDTTRMVKSRKIRLVGFVTWMGDIRNAVRIYLEKTGRGETAWRSKYR